MQEHKRIERSKEVIINGNLVQENLNFGIVTRNEDQEDDKIGEGNLTKREKLEGRILCKGNLPQC